MPSSTPCYHFNSAIVRKPSLSVVNGLRTEDQGDPDYDGVKAEHEAYVAVFESVGIKVTVLPELEAFPDSIFVEDPALVFTEAAILLRPSAPSRRGETEEIAPVLHDLFDKVLQLPQPGHVEGGDILLTQESVLIGLSARTNRTGADALIECLKTFGYTSEIVNTPKGILHLKTECSLLDETTILVTRRMEQSGIFDGFRKIVLPEGEEPAANAIRINKSLLVSTNYPRTIELLDHNGYSVVPVKTTEIQKIDAGLSCMSLRWFAVE